MIDDDMGRRRHMHFPPYVSHKSAGSRSDRCGDRGRSKRTRCSCEALILGAGTGLALHRKSIIGEPIGIAALYDNLARLAHCRLVLGLERARFKGLERGECRPLDPPVRVSQCRHEGVRVRAQLTRFQLGEGVCCSEGNAVVPVVEERGYTCGVLGESRRRHASKVVQRLLEGILPLQTAQQLALHAACHPFVWRLRFSGKSQEDEERLDACVIDRILEEQQDLGHKALEQSSLQFGEYPHKGRRAVFSVQDGLDALQQRLTRP